MNINNNFTAFMAYRISSMTHIDKNKRSNISFSGKNLQNDVFIKTTNPISFKGNDETEKTALNDEDFYKLRNEILRISKFINVYLDKNSKNLIRISKADAKAYPIERLISDTVKPKLQGFATKVFCNYGIKTVADLKDFAAIYKTVCANNKNAELYGFEMLQIFAYDDNPAEKLENFSGLIFHELENNINNRSRDVSSDELYKYVSKLEDMEIRSEKDFKKYFSFIKNSFNDFQNTEDVIEAIDFVEKDYSKNLDFTKGAMEKFDFSKHNLSPALMYLNHAQLIDCIQKEYRELPLERQQELFKKAVDFKDLKASVQKEIKHSYPLDSGQDILDFIKYLESEGFKIQDLETLLLNKKVPDIKTKAIIENKSEIELEIAKIRNCSKEEAKDFYLNFAFGLNSVFNSGEETTCSVAELVGIIDEFNLKDDLDLIRFIEKFNKQGAKALKGKNKKGMTQKNTAASSTIRNFVTLLSFRDGSNIDKFVLLKSKALYESIKTDIEDYIKDDESLRFSGRSAFSVFKEYKSLFEINQNVKEAFENAKIFDDANDEAALEKFRNFTEISKFFNSPDDAKKFIAKNLIELDSKKENEEYRKNIINILNAIYDNNNPQRTEEYIEKLSNSDILINSKTSLSNFLDLYKEADLKLLFETMIDRKIASCADMNRFLNKYTNSIQGINTLLSIIQEFPKDMTFAQYEKELENINSAFLDSGIPIKINAHCISKLDADSFLEFQKGEEGSLYKLAGVLNETRNDNFITGLNSVYSSDGRNISPLRIAREIISKDKAGCTPYSNIKRELGLNDLDFKPSGKEKLWDDELYALAIAEALDDRFIQYVNSDDWYDYNNSYLKPNLTFHSKMRAIERFALEKEGSIDTLYSKDSKQKIKDIFKSLYLQTPSAVKKGNSSDEFVLYSELPDRQIKAVFNNDGKLITIM